MTLQCCSTHSSQQGSEPHPAPSVLGALPSTPRCRWQRDALRAVLWQGQPWLCTLVPHRQRGWGHTFGCQMLPFLLAMLGSQHPNDPGSAAGLWDRGKGGTGAPLQLGGAAGPGEELTGGCFHVGWCRKPLPGGEHPPRSRNFLRGIFLVKHKASGREREAD